MHFRRIGQPTAGPALQTRSHVVHGAPKANLDAWLGALSALDHSSCSHIGAIAAVVRRRLALDDAPQWRKLGGLWLRSGDVDAALHAAELAVNGKKVPADAFVLLGDCLQHKGRDSDAGAYNRAASRSRSATSALSKLCAARLAALDAKHEH